MRAALLLEPGRIVLDEIETPDPAPGEVRVAVGGVGLCGSDMSVFRGAWAAPDYPWILGHEAFGTIDAVGSDVPTSRIGEVVVVEPNIACGRCRPCRRGRTSGCVARQSIGMNRAGALAEWLVVPTSHAWRVAPTAPEDLVCVEPLTVVETALRRLGAVPTGDVLVVGSGAQGLLMCLALTRRGAKVVVTDLDPSRVAFATSLGARPLEAESEDRRFDLAVDTTGAPDGVALAIRRTEFGGTIVELGLDGRPLELSAQLMVRRQLTFQGSLTYDHPMDFASTVALVDEGAVRPGNVISDGFELDEAQAAFDSAPRAAGKTWIRVGGG